MNDPYEEDEELDDYYDAEPDYWDEMLFDAIRQGEYVCNECGAPSYTLLERKIYCKACVEKIEGKDA